ncbi:ATP-binding protein [Saccharopolyspora sp. NPDC002686]|uniref:ATP-binding protein n=1 Tax=Saccharopolyspora sp. NPDC002686 TaxID=3154541 RepID=UPI00332FFEAF
MVEASADGIVAVDERGIIRLANPAAEMLFARSTGDLVGSAFGAPTVVHQTSEIDLIQPDGSARGVEMRVTATTLRGERIYVAALRDVTRRKQAEKDLEVALERQTTVVAVAAHELRTPVAAIKLLVHLLRERRATLSRAVGVGRDPRVHRGPGVPDSFVPHLFERFSREPRARRQMEGAGLGLWIVRNLARATGGEAWYEPNDDEGACFCLRLQGTPNT